MHIPARIPTPVNDLDCPVSAAADKACNARRFMDISEAELGALIQRIEDAITFNLALNPDDYRLLISALGTLATMQDQLSRDDLTLRKLRKLLGMINASEKLKNLQGGDGGAKDKAGADDKGAAEEADGGPGPPRPKPKRPPKPPPAPPVEPENVRHSFDSMSKGDQCPGCTRGKVYKYEPALMLRVTGHAPYSAKRHIRDQLRCNTCGEVFGADLPAEVLADGEPGQLYGYSARSVMAISKFLAGEPYYRQQSVQSLYGIKLSASTIFDQCEYVANDLQPVWREVLKRAANAQVFYIDDTTNRISDQKGMHKPKRGTDKQQWRTGVYSSAMLAVYEEFDEAGVCCVRRLVLYQTSIGHAGEWADEVLGPRDGSLPPPTVISDALSSNRISVTEVLDAKCNVHSRRNFVEVRSHFPSGVDAILELYRQIWINDAHCRNEHHSDEQRQQYHHTHSLPVMQTLQGWCEHALSEKAEGAALALNSTVPESLHNIEPNSSLGTAMSYLLNHYDTLTRYCHYPGIPIDNNEIERLIKLVVRNRKNAGYFKTQAGAWVGDILTSIIAICQENGVNVFDYLTTVQCNRAAVRANPVAWLPWNYTVSA